MIYPSYRIRICGKNKISGRWSSFGTPCRIERKRSVVLSRLQLVLFRVGGDCRRQRYLQMQ